VSSADQWPIGNQSATVNESTIVTRQLAVDHPQSPLGNSRAPQVLSGNHRRGRDHIGAGHDTPASRALVERIDAGSPERPLNVTVWGGQTDLAQALWRVKQDRGMSGFATFARKLRVYDIADQDSLTDWMRIEFPGRFYVLSNAAAGRDRREATFRGMYLTADESLTSRAWIDEPRERIRANW
jgi:Protein of unknown function (DUF1593)